MYFSILFCQFIKKQKFIKSKTDLLRNLNRYVDMILIDNGSREDGKSKYTTHETGHNTYYGGALNIMFQHFLD